MDPEAMKKGSWEEQKKNLGRNPDFHMEEKKDDVEVLIDQLGWENAFQKIEENFDGDLENSEHRRRLALIIKLDDERKARLKTKLNH